MIDNLGMVAPGLVAANGTAGLSANEWAGIAGGVIGTLGGVVGCCVPIWRARPGPERRFLVRASVVAWVGVLAFVAAQLWLVPVGPIAYTPLYAAYTIALVLFIRYCNRGQAELRVHATDVKPR
jgi:hypothetical protein